MRSVFYFDLIILVTSSMLPKGSSSGASAGDDPPDPPLETVDEFLEYADASFSPQQVRRMSSEGWGNWPSDYFEWSTSTSTYNYSYYDTLFEWAMDTKLAKMDEHSDVIKIEEYGETVRIGRIVSMLDVADCCWPSDQKDQLVIARAVTDFNNRSSRTTPSVAALTRGCNFYLSLTIQELSENDWRTANTFHSPVHVWDTHVSSRPRPMGFVGAYEDSWTGILSSLSSGLSKSDELPELDRQEELNVNIDAIPFVSPYSYLLEGADQQLQGQQNLQQQQHSDRESKYTAKIPLGLCW
jgi:hypothetical protein